MGESTFYVNFKPFLYISERLESFALDILRIRNAFYVFVENKHFVQ